MIDPTAPLTVLLQQGTGYVLFVLACIAIAYLMRAREKDRQEILQAYDRRLQDTVTMGNAYNSSINNFAETMREVNRQQDGMAASLLSISKSVEQMVYARGRGGK